MVELVRVQVQVLALARVPAPGAGDSTVQCCEGDTNNTGQWDIVSREQRT